MRTTCLITNYNYRAFVSEAIDSALAQTRPFDEIVVVDDASTDGSIELVRSAYGSNERVRIVEMPCNSGQMAAFIAGVKASNGDIVFFLDADDCYLPSYLERALAAYERPPRPDFIYCAYSMFGTETGVNRRWPRDRDLGISVLRTYYRRRWLGGPTSTLSMRRWVLDAVCPMVRADEWRVRADDVLAYGAGFAGAYKRFIAEALVRYRTHANNNYYGRETEPLRRYRHEVAHARLAGVASQTLQLDFVYLWASVHAEFATIPRPSFRDLRDYFQIGSKRMPVCGKRSRILRSILVHYVGDKFR